MAEYAILPCTEPGSQVWRASGRPAYTWRDGAWALGLALAFFALALFRLEAPASSLFDEVFHAKAGMELAAGRPPSEVTHPPLLKDAIAASLYLTGVPFDPVAHAPQSGGPRTLPPDLVRAWRLPSAIAGAAGVGLLYLLARALLGAPGPAVIAALLLALDGCYFVHARVAQTNVFEVMFVLAASLGAWQAVATGRDRWLPLAGLAIGGALACRWSSASSWLLLGAWLAWSLRGSPVRLVRLGAAWTLVPLVVYAAVYLPLVTMGGDALDAGRWRTVFVDAQVRMYVFHASLAESHAYGSSWWAWPLMLRPVWYGFWPAATGVAAVWAIGNAVVWWGSLPALAIAASAGHRGRRALGFVALLGLGTWIAWALQPRSLTFMHYYLTTIPFACIALAAIGQAWWRGDGVAGGPAPFERPAARVLVGAVALGAVAWFAFYYPLLTAWPVSEAALRSRVWFGAAWL